MLNVLEPLIFLNTVCNSLVLDEHHTFSALNNATQILKHLRRQTWKKKSRLWCWFFLFTTFITIKIYLCLSYNWVSITPLLRPDCSSIHFALHIRYTFRGIWFLWKKVFWFTFYNADTSIKRTLFLGPNGVHFREIPHTAKKCFSLKVDWFRYWLWYAILWS